MKQIKLLLILVLAIFSFALVACGGEKEVDWDSKTISNVTPVNETFYANYEYDEFELSMLKIHIEYTDGTSRDISLTEDMLDAKDLQKLTKAGKPRITIYYEEYELQMTVKLIDSSRLDENLNADGKYACVIKAIRNQETGIINFIFEGNAEYDVVAMSFAFSYDSSLMQLSDAMVNSALTGVGDVKLEDGKISFAYSEQTTSLDGEIVLFSVHYTGDYRNSKLSLLESYNNVVYEADLSTYTTHQVDNVLYHVSAK
ncbi:MAG: hypothetical protein J5691_03090 [Bacilli bacterium]|nr:hypothetical protein [Bacilli bacterium]